MNHQNSKNLTEGGSQAPSQGNINDEYNNMNKSSPKKLVQQIFHPSLFTRTRHPSLGDRPTGSLEPGQLSSNKETNEPTNNEWQTVSPKYQTPGTNKRRRVNRSPSSEPEEIPLQNSFSLLKPEQSDQNPHNQEKVGIRKPPPIILYAVQNIGKLSELIEGVLQKTDYTYKIVNRTQLRVNCNSIDAYKKLMQLIREQKLIGHTFTRKDERPYRIVIKNLHPSTPIEAITEAIENTGNKIKGEVINAKHGPSKKPLFTWFVNLEPSPNNAAIKNLRYIYNTSITIEDPKRKKTIVQCKRCQQYGHTRNNCTRPFRCVKCAGNHNTTDCPKKDRTIPCKCALCHEEHPANYKGCKVFLEIQERKQLRQSNILTRKETILKQNEENTINITAQPSQPVTVEKTYAQVTAGSPINILEKLLIKQAEKLDLLIQNMGTLMSLLTTVINKLHP